MDKPRLARWPYKVLEGYLSEITLSAIQKRVQKNISALEAVFDAAGGRILGLVKTCNVVFFYRDHFLTQHSFAMALHVHETFNASRHVPVTFRS